MPLFVKGEGNIINNTDKGTTDPVIEFNIDTIQKKVLSMNLSMNVRYTTIVEAYIKGYVIRNRPKSQKILGKTLLYFPIFEEKLKKRGLPNDLKYLAVVESALNPTALSRVGAKGLWQFMPETGRDYGLEISDFIDERCDPYDATDAAISYLERLHEKYDDWALAIAAYNSGPGRVNRAIKRARSKNFWKLSRFLPKETRNYVPAFIAAAYLIEHHETHQLEPEYPPFDFQLTESTMVYHTLSFYTVAQVTGLALDIIRELNPKYTDDFVPQSIHGSKMVLPSRVMTAFKDYLTMIKPDPGMDLSMDGVPVYATTPIDVDLQSFYTKSIYTVGEDDDLDELSQLFKCPKHCLVAWNGLQNRELVRGQDLILYQPKEFKRFSMRRDDVKVPAGIPAPGLKSLHSGLAHTTSGISSQQVDNMLYLFYELKMGESLQEVLIKYPNNTIQDLIKLNNLSPENPPLAGTKIKVRKL
ncbi:MAG: transglycosylase SLT domain-containing protein [Saprospiraceae bacterium]|nr:transglycosylase SLT domain-containing protein [Saprospiraceae bacterium]